MPLNEKNRYVHKKYTKLSVEQTIVPGELKFTTLNGKLDFSKKKEKMSERKGFAIL